MEVPERPSVPPDHDVRVAQRREAIRNGLLVIPTAFVLAAIVLALALGAVDDALVDADLDLLYDGDPSAAQTLLATIATSIVTFTSLVISVTVVALQLASQQFSPRVLRTFFRDTGTKVALGIFVSVFVYALVVLRLLDPDGADATVPRLSITVAFLLVLVALGTFVYYVDHVVHAIRIVSIIDQVAAETRAAIREVHVPSEPPVPAEVPDRPADLVLTSERAPGAITTVDEDDLVALAARHRSLIRLVPHMGQFVPSGSPLAEVWGDDGQAPPLTERDVLVHIGLHRERTMTQDVAFGFRQLVDIAEKALSPAVNDPTTAVQVLDRIHDLLRRVAVAPAPSGYHRDATGALRLVLPVAGWEALVALACDEIRLYGGGDPQVQRKMRMMIADLRTVVDDERWAPLAEQLALLDAAVDRHFPDAADRERVRRDGFAC
ncbi:DUF2254 domain-containing protein [Iamia sp. SCSIO 61187]|uniref:DUF2254 domain-containing protein n=1 Tax=Iamia sp. SCSIO 61187 TaxID=2722752 RepID=UPI001C6344F3|nr:DUF2254 domain-containing protein [Iamia sp. SCSIO 61187]QYG91697.1 DUF2254 domain-containing protein [Iamia sp. SCSIO 61187]